MASVQAMCPVSEIIVNGLTFTVLGNDWWVCDADENSNTIHEAAREHVLVSRNDEYIVLTDEQLATVKEIEKSIIDAGLHIFAPQCSQSEGAK